MEANIAGKVYFPLTLHSYSQDQAGFQLISSSFSGGRISCSFTRSVLAANPAEDRNLNESAFVLLALGNTRGICAGTLTNTLNSCSQLLCCYDDLFALFVAVYDDDIHSLHR